MMNIHPYIQLTVEFEVSNKLGFRDCNVSERILKILTLDNRILSRPV